MTSVEKTPENNPDSDRQHQITIFRDNVLSFLNGSGRSIEDQMSPGVQITYPNLPSGFRAFVKRDYWEFGIQWEYGLAVFNLEESVYDPEADTYIFYGVKAEDGDFKKILIHTEQHIPENAEELGDLLEAVEMMNDNVRLELDFADDIPTDEIEAINQDLVSARVVK